MEKELQIIRGPRGMSTLVPAERKALALKPLAVAPTEFKIIDADYTIVTRAESRAMELKQKYGSSPRMGSVSLTDFDSPEIQTFIQEAEAAGLATSTLKKGILALVKGSCDGTETETAADVWNAIGGLHF